jgi:RNA polymerase sigma factor (sigma-70 family)
MVLELLAILAPIPLTKEGGALLLGGRSRESLVAPQRGRKMRDAALATGELDVEAFYGEVRSSLFNYFRRCGVPTDAAEDLTQTTFIALMEARRRFDPARGTARVFLFGIARNLRMSWARSARLRGDVEGQDATESRGKAPAWEDRLAVQSAVRELPEEQREAILLREFHGFCYDEIAELQGVPVGTVRSRLARAREQLRDRLTGGSHELPRLS